MFIAVARSRSRQSRIRNRNMCLAIGWWTHVFNTLRFQPSSQHATRTHYEIDFYFLKVISLIVCRFSFTLAILARERSLCVSSGSGPLTRHEFNSLSHKKLRLLRGLYLSRIHLRKHASHSVISPTELHSYDSHCVNDAVPLAHFQSEVLNY